MNPEEKYIHCVLDNIPPGSALRSQVAMELRSHIAERLESGQSVDDAIRNFGDPATLAESYLSAVPLVSASFWSRAVAKGIDGGLFLLCGLIAWKSAGPYFVFVIPVAMLTFIAYIILAEYCFGQTLGKRLLGLCVVRESGARISLGQSLVRQLPVLSQIFLLDVLFALFTQKKQRAFELVSKTRVVRVS